MSLLSTGMQYLNPLFPFFVFGLSNISYDYDKNIILLLDTRQFLPLPETSTCSKSVSAPYASVIGGGSHIFYPKND